ncbi:Alpha/beta hydrolase fold-3 domain protein OS=Tsukamurella paurometabola (strain ATCC 8368 / DSM/ CCUG 35730 / CIP 100753 / JCM 10117 / KCTC 9821 / NBRC 16120 / NCIMB 702349 / NCTC 13040) OX=521096 GN=Tpau_3769 PE=4 SV=1 [Tsukamurella paurometabola]|uniref:Alpha/beta hydrolase fold-3 domain protein n=1 Tax=Tsukamurella paurometabola (strain ATCC 8368 / DSM 20162 / CCUG 35730 / CIP 100753 / JCM 10117 / KCTC 9821 / NBRC 16120 / NCIMB 702349 / NCTC 13040) TaxID=521096 RepID=D5UYP4_TSUPD|nr:alpha/beta hydrolase [Tsukamurella paurometabola]ADG80347.1 Alpha/beta hydrolase fold-3 domain protein [Tsukamurella paurometabola DSM 20162]SUP39320.1 Acetyl esterase [Tsukamurella paurometabola]
MAVIAHRGRSARSRVVLWFVRIVMKTIFRLFPLSDRTLPLLRAVEPYLSRVPQSVRGVRIEKVTLGGVPTERIVPDGDADPHPRAALIYYHGGAFIGCNLDTHRRIAVLLARGLRVPVYNVEYRQYPDGGVGTSVADGFAAYRELLDSGDVDRILVAGDSAGGFVCAKVIQYAAEAGVQRPTAFAGFSPFLDISATLPRSSRHDAMLPLAKIRKLRTVLGRGPEDLRGPEDMTTDATAAYFPPTILFAADREALMVDSLELHGSLDRAGVPNEVHIYDGQVHAFVVGAGITPESWNAYKVTVAFLSDRLTEAESQEVDARVSPEHHLAS